MGETTYEEDKTGKWVAAALFAAVIMTMSGALNICYGVIAAINDEWVVFGNRGDLYFDISEWGWIHIILGVVVLASGLALFSGNVAARTVGVIFAAVSILANFLWLPAYPIWSIIIIALDVLVIWALTVHGRELAI
jgi:hypothetical protein